MPRSTTFRTFLIVIILIFSIANYYQLISKSPEISHPKLPPPPSNLSEKFEIRELRRQALLLADKVKKSILDHAIGRDNKNFYPKIKAEAFCDKVIRIGEHGDGGKIVCNPENVKDDCTLMSLGLNNQVEYDLKIWNVTGGRCMIIGADKDPQNHQTARAYASIKGQLYSGKIPDEIGIQEILEKANRKDVEILKIDIEGGEHEGLEPFLKEVFVCQILIEIHGWPPEHLAMLQKISRHGFRLFNIEPNPLCHRCCEYSLINELCMHQFNTIPLADHIPPPKTIQNSYN